MVFVFSGIAICKYIYAKKNSNSNNTSNNEYISVVQSIHSLNIDRDNRSANGDVRNASTAELESLAPNIN